MSSVRTFDRPGEIDCRVDLVQPRDSRRVDAGVDEGLPKKSVSLPVGGGGGWA